MSVLALTGAMARSQPRTIVVAHFDAHGVATGAVLAAALNGQVIARFPDTGPQRFAQFAKTIDVYNAYVHIVDIPINVSAPKEHLEALEALATQAEKVVLWDHHETDLKYIHEFRRVELRYFSSAIDMALAIAQYHEDPRYHELLYVGVVADRDAGILRVVDRETVERQLMPMANILDIMVRQDAQAIANTLIEQGVDVLRTALAQHEYPPQRLAQQLRHARRGARAVLLQPVDTVEWREMESWLPKTLEQYLLATGLDYAIVPSRQIDRRTNEPFWAVRVLKYWLSSQPPPAHVLRGLEELRGRQIVGHEDYITIRAVDEKDAVELAQRVYDALEYPVSQTAHLISERYVAQAIQADYNKIIRFLERIAKALEEGAEAKKEQVDLLRRLYQQDERTRYD